jgi:hypothetical protein
MNRGIFRPEKPVATITIGLDRVIKEYFNKYRDKDTLPPFLEKKIPGKLIRNLPSWLEFKDLNLDAKLYGYLDECLIIDDNFYAPLDHKTRGNIPEDTHPAYQLQMDVYTFLLEQNNFPTKNKAYLVYYIPKGGDLFNNGFQFDVYPVELRTEPKKAKQIFYMAISTLREDQIPKQNKDCLFCNWFERIKGEV